jgi:hypothetical protein
MGGWDGPICPPAVADPAGGLIAMHWRATGTDPNFGGAGFAICDLPGQQSVTKLLDASGSTVGVGAHDEPMAPSVHGDVVVVVHNAGFTGNPDHQSGAFVRSQRTWYVGGDTPSPPGGHWAGNLCGGGANPVSGADGRLYHHTLTWVYCLESRN